MITPAYLASRFAANVRIVAMQCDGLTHADSLVQPQPSGNCLNWTVGHLLVHRNIISRALGGAELLTPDALAPYNRESDPITSDGKGILPLSALLDWLNQGQQVIDEKLAPLTAETTQAPYTFPSGRVVPLGEMLLFYYFHDTYHVGQTEYLRQLAGRGEKVI